MIIEISKFSNIVVKSSFYNIYYARIYFLCNDGAILDYIILFIGFPQMKDVILSLCYNHRQYKLSIVKVNMSKMPFMQKES